MAERKIIWIGLLSLLSSVWAWGQHYPKLNSRNYVSDSTYLLPKKPWLATAEVVGLNIAIWGFDRFALNADFARINRQTIKNNFKTGPVWDTDMFSTNLVAHPYHGSLYFNAARSNGLNFWQSIPYVAGGSLMWEFFMENEAPSINDLLATTFGGVELGEITYRLSDLFIDDRTSGAERVGREILTGLISPVRGINRLITGESWKRRTQKGRTYSRVPVNFVLILGPRFLAEQEHSRRATTSLHLGLRLDYGDPFEDEFYSPYEWFQLRAGFDFLSSQPLITQVSAIGALWGKRVWENGPRSLMAGVFQHFDYYDSQLRSSGDDKISPYRISEAAALGGGLIYYKQAEPSDKVDAFGSFYLNGIALGGSTSDYFRLDNRDYNMGSGYSLKVFSGLTYNQRWSFLLNLENYHIFTWKGYDPDIDLSTVDPHTFNVQGDKGDSRLTVLEMRLVYLSNKRWNISLSNRFFSRRTHYFYHENVTHSNYDLRLGFGIKI